MSITEETLKQHLKDPAVLCCRREKGTVISAQDLEDPSLFDDIVGAGRSGFAARAFSNRLMHLGFDSRFVGEPTTPSIRKGDLLIIGSGSGKTESLVTMAKKAKSEEAKLATITISPEGEIGSMADAYIQIPGISSRGPVVEKAPSIQPHGSSFEQLAWLVYDSMIIDLKKQTNQEQGDMDHRHANME